MAQHAAPIEGQSDEHAGDGIEEAYLQQLVAGYLHPHAVRDQRRRRRHPVRNGVHQTQDAGGAQGGEEKSCETHEGNDGLSMEVRRESSLRFSRNGERSK